MSNEDKSEVMAALGRVEAKCDRIQTALTGDMTPNNRGALHALEVVTDEVFQPKRPDRSHGARLEVLENDRSKRIGLVAAVSIGGVVVGALIPVVLHFIK